MTKKNTNLITDKSCTRGNYSPYHVVNKNFAKGGNAKVLLVNDSSGEEYVLKSIVLNDKKDIKKIKRFIDEIAIVEKYQGNIKGIVPIVYNYIPEVLKNTLSNLKKIDDDTLNGLKGTEVWYVMKLATPIKEKIESEQNVELIIDCMISLSQTLSELHKNNIVHRDIKPSNLYFYNGDWAFGDFGLVEYPEFKGETDKGERIGNYATIAPEMRHINISEDAKPADVWSMAKTLWMLLTNSFEKSFEGLYNSKDNYVSISEKSHYLDIPLQPLENILENVLKYEAEERPDIDAFLNMLTTYKKILQYKNSFIDMGKIIQNSSESKVNFLINTADTLHNTINIINDFEMNLISEEQCFIYKDLGNSVKILKYISTKLKNNCINNFLVSPILGFSRNRELPSIKIFVKYNDTLSKYVTDIVVCNDENTIEDIARLKSLNQCFDHNNEIKWDCVDFFIDYLDKTAFEPSQTALENMALNMFVNQEISKAEKSKV